MEMHNKYNQLLLVYGDNGEGKSLYYKNKLLDPNYLAFNYDLEKWYDPETETFSQFNIKGRILEKNIIDLNKNFFKDLKKELNFSMTISEINKTFKNIIEDINKSNSYNIKEYKDNYNIYNIIEYINDWCNQINNNKKYIELDEESINSYLEIYLSYKKYKRIFNKIFLDETKFINICIYIKLHNYQEEEFLKNNIWNSCILKIKNKTKDIFLNYIKKYLDNCNEYDHSEKIVRTIEKMNVNLLYKIYKDFQSSDVINWINNYIFYKKLLGSETFKTLKLKIDEYNKMKEQCFKFNNFDLNRYKIENFIFKNELNYKIYNSLRNINISEDGLILQNIGDLFKYLSNGEKIIAIFTIFLPYLFEQNKTILLDDIFEKLDIYNCSNFIKLLFYELSEYNENKKKKIEILTHDINLLKLFMDIYDECEYFKNDKFKIIYPRIKMINNVFGLDIKGTTERYIFSFEDLLRNLKNKFNNTEKFGWLHENSKTLLNFCKYFYRYETNNNWIQLLSIYKHKTLNEITSIKIYNFISENIFHYSPMILIDDNEQELKEIFCEFDPKSDFYIFNENNYSTLDFYDYFIDKLENTNEDYKIDCKKLSIDIKKMRTFIIMEKNYYEENKDSYNFRKSSKEFYKKHWKQHPKEWNERNNIAHFFNKTLIKYKK